MSDTPEYVLMKRGLYWRQNSQGYTGLLSEAGRYALAEAEEATRGGSTYMLASEAPRYAPNCCKDIKEADQAKRNFNVGDDDPCGLTRSQLKQYVELQQSQARTIERLMVILKAGHVLSTWADCINWNARDKDNQGEWLDELKDRIKAFQELEATFYSDHGTQAKQ